MTDAPEKKLDGGENAPASGWNLLDILAVGGTKESDKSRKQRPIGEDIDNLLSVFGMLPEQFQCNPRDYLPWLERLGIKPGDQGMAIFNGVSKLEKNGERISVSRDNPVRLELNQKLIDGVLEIKSVDFGNLAFDLSAKERKLSRIDGLTVELEIGGETKRIAVRALTLDKDEKGNILVKTRVDNPAPGPLAYIFGMPASIDIAFALGEDGRPLPVKTSDAIRQASANTGYTLPGLLLGAALDKAADAIDIADSNSGALDRASTAAMSALDLTSPGLALAVRHRDVSLELAKKALLGPVGTILADRHSGLFDLARQASLGPAGSYLADRAWDNRGKIATAAKTGAKAAFYASPVGAAYGAYNYIFGK